MGTRGGGEGGWWSRRSGGKDEWGMRREAGGVGERYLHILTEIVRCGRLDAVWDWRNHIGGRKYEGSKGRVGSCVRRRSVGGA